MTAFVLSDKTILILTRLLLIDKKTGIVYDSVQVYVTRGPAIVKRSRDWCSTSAEILSTAVWIKQTDCVSIRRPLSATANFYSTTSIVHKNSSGDEIANVNLLTTISHTRRPTLKYRKRDKPTSFNKLDDRLASTAHEVLNF